MKKATSVIGHITTLICYVPPTPIKTNKYNTKKGIIQNSVQGCSKKLHHLKMRFLVLVENRSTPEPC